MELLLMIDDPGSVGSPDHCGDPPFRLRPLSADMRFSP